MYGLKLVPFKAASFSAACKARTLHEGAFWPVIIESMTLNAQIGAWKEAGLGLARRMDWARGLRAGTALCVPLLAADFTGVAALGWTALGGFEAVISDGGGPYRSRLGRLSLLSLGGGFACALGTVVGGDLRWALPVTVLFCFLWSYLAVLGQPFASSGLLVQVIYICGLGAPDPSWRVALTRGLLLLGGGVWAIAFSLALWPFDPYRPARKAVSECYASLASFLAGITELHTREQVRPALWHRLATHHQQRLRSAIETAWQAVASVRAESLDETAQGGNLVVLLETADMLLARTVALAEHLEATSMPPNPTGCGEQGYLGLSELRGAEEWVADILRRRVKTAAAESVELRGALAALPASLRHCLSYEDSSGQFLLGQVAESLSLAETAVEAATLLRLGEAGNLPMGAGGSHVRKRLERLREGLRPGKLRDNFHRDSLLLRHALRVSIVCGLDVVLIGLLHVDHGYWLLMTSLIVLQPHVGGTMRRGLERTAGTVAGGILAAFLAVTLHSPLITALALFPLAVLCLAFLPVSYAIFAFFLTPAFVLAYLPHPGDWQLALVRVGDTATGAVIALAAMRLLFPSFELDRIANYLLASLDANRRYLGALAESWKSREPAGRALAQARRATGLAHNATEESLDRVLAERWTSMGSGKGSGAEAALAVTTYLRRFAQSITTLTTLDGILEWKRSAGVSERLRRIERGLERLDQMLRCGDAELSGALEPPTGEMQSGTQSEFSEMGDRQLGRLERQISVLDRQVRALRNQQWLRCP